MYVMGEGEGSECFWQSLGRLQSSLSVMLQIVHSTEERFLFWETMILFDILSMSSSPEEISFDF